MRDPGWLARRLEEIAVARMNCPGCRNNDHLKCKDWEERIAACCCGVVYLGEDLSDYFKPKP